jgi:hypothetical protein
MSGTFFRKEEAWHDGGERNITKWKLYVILCVLSLNEHYVYHWLGANKAQWFQLRPELEAQDWGDSPTLFEWSQ